MNDTLLLPVSDTTPYIFLMMEADIGGAKPIVPQNDEPGVRHR